MKPLITLLGALVLLVMVMFYSAFTWGYILFRYSEWFIAPVFTSFPVVSYVQCIGLMFVIGLFKSHNTNKYTYEGIEIKSESNYGVYFIAPWVILLLGYIVHIFVVK